MGTAVEVHNLVKRYKDLVALDHFSLKIEEGEIIRTSWSEWFRKDNDNQLYSVTTFI